MNKKFSLGALFKNNRFVLVFSIVASIITWFAVSIIVSPETTRVVSEVPVNIPLSSSAFSGMKVYGGADTKVSVTLQGKKYVVDQADPSDVLVTADLSEVNGVGNYTLNLSARKAGGGEFEIVEVVPSTINVSIDNEATQEFDVQISSPIQAADDQVEGVRVVEPTFSDTSNAKITITGPDSEIKQIVNVAAVIPQTDEKITQTKQFSAYIYLYDEDNNVLFDPLKQNNSILKYVQLEFTELQITVQLNVIKTVPLKVRLQNAPTTTPGITIFEQTGSNTPIQTIVSTIRIKGSVDTLSSVQEIYLDGSYDFSTLDPDASATWQKTFQLPSMPGITYVDYANVTDGVRFVVRVDSEGISSKTFDISAGLISVENLTEGLTATIQSQLKGVEVIGPSSSLRNLKGSDFLVSVDAKDLAAGSYTLKPTIRFSSADDCWAIGSYEVTVQIR